MESRRRASAPASRRQRPRTELKLLGPFVLVVDGRRFDAVRASRLESLVAFLALRQGVPVPRAEVAFALWPDSAEGQALTNLRRELHALRHAMPGTDGLVLADRRTLEWPANGRASVDVTAFRAALDRASAGDPDGLPEAIRLYGGDLLPSCYDDWIAAERDALRAAFAQALDDQARGLELSGRYGEAIGLLRRLVQLDPLHEPPYQSIMRIAALAGDRAAGVQAYHACAAALRRELAVEPSPETETAFRRLIANDEPLHRPAAIAAAAPAPGSALVGRAAGRATFLEALTQAASSRPTLLLVSGEPGIGKTALLEEGMRWASGQGFASAYTRSYEAEGGLAFGPIADWLRSTALRPAVDRADLVWRAEVARLLPEVSATPEVVRGPGRESWGRHRLFEAIVEVVRAARTPTLLALDDAQWADEDTLAWLHYLLRDVPPLDALVVLAARTGERDSNRALASLVAGMRSRDQLDEIELGPLGEDETAELATRVAGRTLGPAELDLLYRQTAGQPLFVVESVRAGMPVIGVAAEGSSRGLDEQPPEHAIPPRIRAVIASQLDRLSPAARGLAEIAAVVGRDFSFDLLDALSDLDSAALAQAIDELWRRQVFRVLELDSYDFRHDRVREVAYAAIGPARRRLLHRRIAETTELLHVGSFDAVAAQLAGHYEAAGLVEQAVGSYERAGVVAAGLYANGEAVRHLRKALALLARLPVGVDRDRRELAIQLSIAGPLNGQSGYASPALEAALERVEALSRELGERGEQAGALGGLAAVYFVRAEFRRSLEAADRAIGLVGDAGEHAAAAHMARGWPVLALGDLDAAIDAFGRALAAYRPGHSRPFASSFDVATFAMASQSHALWLAGHERAAVEEAEEAVARAAASGNPHLQAMAHAYAGVVHQFRDDVDAVSEHARAAIDLSRRFELAYYGEWGEILDGWVERRDAPIEGLARIEAALARLRSLRAESRRPYYLWLLAETHAAAGRPERALATLDAALATANANDDRWWLPEIHRLIGEVRSGPGTSPHLSAALELARGERSPSLVLRAAISLARGDPVAGYSELERALADLPADGPVRERVVGDALLTSLSARA